VSSGWLDGKVALVTGAASGIGAAVARRFVAEGARVVAFDKSQDGLATLGEALGASAATVQGDVRSLDDHKRSVRLAEETFGKLDVYVGNAGIFDGFRALEALQEGDLGPLFQEVFEVNVRGYLYGAWAAVGALRRSGGCMVFTVSSAGFYPGGGGPIYTASKHAVLGLVRQLAYELAPEIRVNGVAPGLTLTGLRSAEAIGGMRGFADDPNVEELARQRTTLRIAPKPEDQVAAYVLLASDQSRAMTGTVINSDAGTGVRRPARD
jgi:NAD(P)-dependent dehydrogenase (short-subunit alcohol dehydrogenase family)